MPVAEAQGLIQLVIQLGFAATMCIFIFVAYQKLVNRLADIIQENTQAMTRLREVIAFLCTRFDSAERAGQVQMNAAGEMVVRPRAGGRRIYDDPGGE